MNLQLMLQYHRYRRNMTQADLARASGLLQPNISRLEIKSSGVSINTVNRLSKALGVSPVDLLDESIFLNQGRNATLSRDELERIASAVWDKNIKLSPHLTKIVRIYKNLVPGIMKRYVPKQKSYMAWLELKTILSPQEIQNLQTRIGKARQRYDASGKN